jgi:RNA polymerase sigma-70 factor (ECF subfamily)
MPADAVPFTDLGETEARRIALGLRRRDAGLVDELVERYQPRLVRYLVYLTGRREFVEDLVQETWLRVYDRGSQYDGRSRFEGWLFSIARHLAIDYLRRQRVFDLEAPEPAASDDLSPFLAAAKSQDAARLAVALNGMGPIYREVLLLRFQEELSLQEIADLVGAPVPTVASRIRRGLGLLRTQLEGDTHAC